MKKINIEPYMVELYPKLYKNLLQIIDENKKEIEKLNKDS